MAKLPVEKTCQFVSCGVVFTAVGQGSHLRRYCDVHSVKARKPRAHVAGVTVKGRCAECGKKIPIARSRQPNVKYCSAECRQVKGRVGVRERAERLVELVGDDGSKAEGGVFRDGPVLEWLRNHPDVLRRALIGKLSGKEVAKLSGFTGAGVSRALATERINRKLLVKAGVWEPPRLVKAMLPTEKLLRVKALGPKGEGTEEFEGLVDELVRAYSVFSRYYFRLEGVRPLIQDFHLSWIRAIIVAWAVGGKQLILSPLRHGKSELLIRFVVWMIVMFPNIRIVWVAANSDVAKIMLGAVKDHLDNNTELVRDTLPLGETYRPDSRSGRPWSGKEIKVRQQSHVGAKSSSMLALGATSKILSRDMDLLIVDDLEDFDSTYELAQRKKTKAKFAEYGTRKTELTAWIDIGSRQNADDVSGSLLKVEGQDQAWRILVNTAHEDCQLDPDVIEGHDENGCVLFPEVRSYRWLMEKKMEMEALGVVGAYEMRYLNKPAPTSGIVFHVDQIRDKALDRSRDLGVEGLVGGRLVAGLDPASRGQQAAFGWHFVPGALSMIDLEVQQAGGFSGALDVMEDWAIRYRLLDWYYEDNSQQNEFFRDPRVTELKRRYGITITPHTTGKNKQDPELGISSMAPWYHDGTIILPYGTPEARRKVNVLISQLELWTTDGVTFGRHRKTDVKMASWFPFPRIVRWNRQANHQTRISRGPEQSYPGVSHSNAVPWATKYPKGR